MNVGGKHQEDAQSQSQDGSDYKGDTEVINEGRKEQGFMAEQI